MRAALCVEIVIIVSMLSAACFSNRHSGRSLMRHISSVVSSVAAAFVLLFTNGAAVASEPFERKQQPVTTEQVPAAVKATIEQELKGGVVSRVWWKREVAHSSGW